MKQLTILCLLAILLTGSAPGQATQLDALRQKLDTIGNLRIDVTNFQMSKEGNVIIKPPSGMLHFESDGMEVFAGRAEYIAASEQLRFTGDVAIYREGVIYRGEKATYNLNSRQLDASGMRSSIEPLFFKAANISSTGTGSGSGISVINLDSPEFTTEDSEDPGYRITADRVSIYPGDRVVFHKFKILAGDSPLFYLPYLSQPLDGEFGYSIIPGYRSNLGAFLLNQYSTTISDHSLIKYRLDLYSQRGAGAGFDLESRRYPRSSQFGKFKFYWLYDNDPETSSIGSLDSISRDFVDNNRYRVNLHHRVYLPGPEQGDFYVDVDINKVSDGFFYEDFFQSEFRDDPQPDNIINFVKRHDRGEISLLGRFRINDFYESDTRLPELALDRVRQPVFNTGLFYAGSSSIGILEDRMSDDDERFIRGRIAVLESLPPDPARASQIAGLRSSLITPGYTRSHSWNELYYPFRFADGAVTVTPRAGIGYTSYSSIDGPEPLDDSRLIFSAGLDAALKISRVYDDVVIPALGIDGLRHIVQPYASWSYVSADEPGGGFMGIDRLAPSTRPRPLEVSNFKAIDSLRDWNLVRLGVAQRLQTRRNRTTYNWLSSNTYIDAFIDDPEYDRDFSNLYQDVAWHPVPWARLNLGAQVPVSNRAGNFSEVNTRATFMPTDSVELSVGHRMLSDHPVFSDSSLLDFGAYARLSENWGVSIYERFEMDDNTLETQQYTIHRDLTSWIASVGAIVRDNRTEKEWGLLLSLTLKDFPGVRIPVDFDPQGGRQ